ncbi:MAG: PD40 domain-containing protein [Elusimicrobia bacterium]|nr:PD40 domain-containing protein [Elusimicrobiota bacterium]
MMASYGSAVAALLVLLSPSARPLRAQGFGQNHVVLRDFEWKVRSTEHFDIHYYEGSANLVPAAAEILERSYKRISSQLGTGFKEKRPFFLYANTNEFQQSNIVETSDGTGGVTEPSKDRFMVYNDGSQQWLDDVTTHELVHVFQYSVLVSGFWKSVRILKTIVYPLWMMEGMAEYFTAGLDDTTGEQYVRDAATSGGLIPLYKLEHFSALKPHQVTLAYKSGAAVMRFLATQYGKEKIGKMLKMFEARFEASSVLQDLIGTDLMTFDRKWREYEEERGRKTVRDQRLKEPWEFGVALTTSTGFLPEFNSAPVLTPDGRMLAYLSSSKGFPSQVMIKDLADKRTRAAVAFEYSRIENISSGNFTNLSRVLAMSPNGRWLAFGAQKNHRHSLFFYDLKTRRLKKVALPGLTSAQQPAFSPDGSRIAFSGMKDGLTDIYVLDVKTDQISAVTSDPQDDQSPSFSPDGQSIVYSSEVHVPGSDMPYQRRLYRLSLKDGSMQRLVDVPGAARDPVYSADGSRILFTVEGWGFTDVYELESSRRTVTRLTRTIAGAFTPTYAANGDVVFASFRRGNVHVYRAPRGGLLAEPVTERAAGRSVTWFEPQPPSESPQAKAPLLRGLPGMNSAEGGPETVSVSTAPFLTPPRPFKDSASTDLFLPAAYYSSPGGLFWTSYWQGSDMLGNHQGTAIVSYNSGARFLNYQTQYAYNRYRPQFALGAFGVREENLVDLASGFRTDVTQHTQVGAVRYPLDRFHRVELTAGAVTERRGYPAIVGSSTRRDARIWSTSFVRDTVGGRYLVETRGSRLWANYYRAVPVLGGHTETSTVSGEAHQLLPTGDMSTLALRAYGANSLGREPQGFVLGGLGGVRGYGRSTVDNVGTRIAVANAEYRFPIFKNLDYYMWYIFPDLYFKAITGAIFTDAGYAWDSKHELAQSRWNTIRNSYGAELRIHTFILQLFQLVVTFDYARRTTSPGGIFYVYVGALY